MRYIHDIVTHWNAVSKSVGLPQRVWKLQCKLQRTSLMDTYSKFGVWQGAVQTSTAIERHTRLEVLELRVVPSSRQPISGDRNHKRLATRVRMKPRSQCLSW
jgi:hypothetical protein